MAVGGRDGDADARADGDHVALDDVGLADDLDEPLRQHGQLLRRLHLRHQDGELIAAEPRRGIALTQDALDAGGDILQQPVADGVTERVVDQLEVVEVDAQRADETAGAAALHQRVGHALPEQHAIGQIGEPVVVRHVRDARLGRLALGDVDDGDQHSRGAFVLELAREHDHLDDAAVAGAVFRGADAGSIWTVFTAATARRPRCASRAASPTEGARG